MSAKSGSATTKLGRVFVERELELRSRSRGRATGKAFVRVGKPRLDDDGETWVCVFQIEVPGEKTIVRRMFGVDGMQALGFALEAAAREVRGWAGYLGRRLTWLGSDDLRLPVDAATRSGRGRLPSPGRGARRRGRGARSGPSRRR